MGCAICSISDVHNVALNLPLASDFRVFCVLSALGRRIDERYGAFRDSLCHISLHVQQHILHLPRRVNFQRY